MKSLSTNVSKQQQLTNNNKSDLTMQTKISSTTSSKLQQRNANKTRHRIKPAEVIYLFFF